MHRSRYRLTEQHLMVSFSTIPINDSGERGARPFDFGSLKTHTLEQRGMLKTTWVIQRQGIYGGDPKEPEFTTLHTHSRFCDCIKTLRLDYIMSPLEPLGFPNRHHDATLSFPDWF